MLELAPRLLGGVLRRDGPEGAVAVRITEVEAYGGGHDPGAHSFRGRTARNATMFGPPGHLYCYFTYGMHHALNVVCHSEGVATGVLLRAGEVVVGEEAARARREAFRAERAAARLRRSPGAAAPSRAIPFRELARGPGNLAGVFGATRADDGADLAGEEWSWWLPHEGLGLAERGIEERGAAGDRRFELGEAPALPEGMRQGPRVGVAGPGGDAEAFPWRFWLDGEPSVSAYRPAVKRRRGGASAS